MSKNSLKALFKGASIDYICLCISLILSIFDLGRHYAVFPPVKLLVTVGIVCGLVILLVYRLNQRIQQLTVMLYLAYGICLAINLPYLVPNAFVSTVHLHSFWHLGIGLALTIICGFTIGRKHILFLGSLNLVLYVLAIALLNDTTTDVYDFQSQSVLLFGSLMFLFYWLFSNLQNVNIQLSKEKDDVCLQNMQLTKVNDALLKQRIMTNNTALETIAHLEAINKEIKSKLKNPLHELSHDVQLKLHQMIRNNKLLVKDMTIDTHYDEKMALLKTHYPLIGHTAAQIAVYSAIGFSVLQIADILNKSESTINNYRQELRIEFKLSSAHDLNKFLSDFFEKNGYKTIKTD